MANAIWQSGDLSQSGAIWRAVIWQPGESGRSGNAADLPNWRINDPGSGTLGLGNRSVRRTRFWTRGGSNSRFGSEAVPFQFRAGSGLRPEPVGPPTRVGPGSWDPGPRSRDPGPGSRGAGPGSRVPGPGARVLGPGTRVLGLGTQNVGLFSNTYMPVFVTAGCEARPGNSIPGPASRDPGP